MNLVLALKIAGPVIGLIGTTLLAKRVTQILETLVQTAKAHDLFVMSIAARAQERDVPVVASYEHDVDPDKVQEGTGTKLLVADFSLQIAGMAFNAPAQLV